jgi:V/A-type H+-transporting ATPase subunit I
MRLPEPIRMERVAVVAPLAGLRPVLLAVGGAGVVEPELIPDAPPAPEFAAEPELGRIAGSTVRHGEVAAFAGWSPASAVAPLAERLRPLGGAVVRLPFPASAEPPTLLATGGTSAAFQPLVDIYDTVPYADVNPSLFAGLAYVAMFGMMFGDVGHGALLLAAGIVLARVHSGPLAAYRRAALFVIGAGATSIVFGFAYGEAFGPTGLVPTLWLSPLAQPVTLLAAGIGVGAGLLAISYGFGTANRWREGGPALALVALSGFAGSALYLGLALAGAGLLLHALAVTVAGGVLAVIGLTLGYTGLYLQGGRRAAGAVEAGVELFDAVVRIGSNTVSFGRLAAFGLMHAALGAIFWSGTLAVAHHGAAWWPLAALVFLAGNAIAFTLEALVAGVQALRLDYYELFSRIFVGTGRTFRPWHFAPPTAQETPS